MTTTKPTAHHEVLDPCLLGRPVHLLHLFAAQLRDDLTQAMRLNMNRRYWGGFRVEDVRFTRFDGGEVRSRWLGFAAPAGNISFSLERKVLLSVLNFRYGSSGKSDGAAAPADEATVRVTATEERLAVVLGQQLAGTLAGRIELNLPATDKAPADGEQDGVDTGVETGFKPTPGAPPPKGSWTITVTLAPLHGDATAGVGGGQFWFALDKALMASVLRGLLPARDGAKKIQPAPPLAQRLQVGLTGRLASKEVLLGALYDLQVGDVIPISLSRADVLLEESRLFTAAVTEHKGKLCLTSFEDVE